jgi:hypothetical protein
MAALVVEPRVIALYEGWCARLLPPIQAVVRTHAAGRPTRPLVVGLRTQWRANAREALRLVRDDLGLAWPWCAMELISTFANMLHIHDVSPVAARIALEHVVLAPPLIVPRSAPPPDETLEEMLLRLAAPLVAALEYINAKRDDPMGWAVADEEKYRRWGRWFYETLVKQPKESVSALAAKHCAVEHANTNLSADHDCRKRVRYGITEARRVLDVMSTIFPRRGAARRANGRSR